MNLNNLVEICWLFSRFKCQFRFRGTSRIDSSKVYLHDWEKLCERTKSMLSWPHAGSHFVFEENKVLSVNEAEDQLENFTILKIDINLFDQLLLPKPMHSRRMWIRKK